MHSGCDIYSPNRLAYALRYDWRGLLNMMNQLSLLEIAEHLHLVHESEYRYTLAWKGTETGNALSQIGMGGEDFLELYANSPYRAGSHCNSCLLVRSFKENRHDAIIPDHDSVRACGMGRP